MKALLKASALLLLVGSNSDGVETWVDERLEVREGLVVWLDASAQNEARQQRTEPVVPDGDPLPVWYDGSGHGRHLRQLDPVRQPAIRLAGARAFVRFDGQSDFLSADGLKVSFDECTIFVVAAPVSNDGSFSGIVSITGDQQEDYKSGLNIDLGPYVSNGFETVNVEGSGFSGVRDLRTSAAPFRHVDRLCVTAATGGDGVKLFVNGDRERSRDRAQSTIHMDQLVIGARRYGVPRNVLGFFAGEVAEVILFDRVLSDDERAKVDQYLGAKYKDVEQVPPLSTVAGAKPLEYLADVPAVQMFVPGFAVRELPVELSNINNMLYRADGKLVALAYDGNIYLLSDADGDGVEDKASLYWENKGQLTAPIGMDLTPRGFRHGNGVFVTSKTKCLLIVDTDGDDLGDKEIVVADGWQQTFHGVDALGMAVDPRDGSVYFGIGTQNFADAYVRDEGGKAQFRIEGERGTIQRVSPDFKSRDTIATGVRFPVAIRLNKQGDLFCTDQEGATWLANGNPLDELLHIDRDRKRHYGFPPRHPRHLPGVIDEPSLFDYAPQHQSTCGLNFNEPVNGGPTFGPTWWAGDAIVTGYSRGKLYRTKLVKTSAAYVAQNQLIASLSALTVDACVSPDGGLVIATHSGGPDWGSGPSGSGKLFKVAYRHRDVPIPVAVWPRTPHEIRIAFDRVIDSQEADALVSNIAIEYGRYVGAGDRFERLHPPYALVGKQANSPRFELKVLDASLSPNRRILILSTAPHSAAVNYALTLPRLGREEPNVAEGELSQFSGIDLAYDLTGAEAHWQPASVDPPWHGWIPHIELAVARQLTRESADHDDLWRLLEQPGTLTIRTQLNLAQMLHPRVQPGSQIDFEYPPEQTTIVLGSNCPMDVTIDGEAIRITREADKWFAELSRGSSKEAAVHQLELRLRHEPDAASPLLVASYYTNEDSTPRALPLARLFTPWATVTDDERIVVSNRDVPELQGGNWLRGKEIFFGQQAMCSKCHRLRGEGGEIGPDLSNLPHRDYASVLRDITKPSYAINPDFVTHTVVTASGQVLTGSIRHEGDTLLIGDQDGKQTRIARDDVEDMQPSPISVMPEKTADAIGPEKLRDLLTFLLVEPPSMPNYGPLPPPPPRSINEVQAVLAGAPEKTSTRPIHVVLVAGRKDHGPGEHDYPAWLVSWRDLLSMAEETHVTTANDWPTTDDLNSADVLVFYQQGTWTPDRARDIDQFLSRGGGLVYIHFAVDGGQDTPGFAKRIGLAWQGGRSKFRHGPLDVEFSSVSKHPISRNFERVHFYDESYWNLLGDPNGVRLLGTGVEEGSAQPLFWTATHNQGRVFVSIPGHFAWTFDDPLFRTLLLRGIAWAASEPVDRFNQLVTPGARVRGPK